MKLTQQDIEAGKVLRTPVPWQEGTTATVSLVAKSGQYRVTFASGPADVLTTHFNYWITVLAWLGETGANARSVAALDTWEEVPDAGAL
jgi:hypothetical protein